MARCPLARLTSQFDKHWRQLQKQLQKYNIRDNISPFTCHKTHICLQILIRPSKKCMPNPKLPACSALNVTLCRVSHSCDKCQQYRHPPGDSDKLVVQTNELLFFHADTKYLLSFCSLINSDTLIQSTMCSAE